MRCIHAALACVLLVGAASAREPSLKASLPPVPQPATVQPPAPVAGRSDEGVVGVIAGMEGGTYARTAADLTILDGDGLRVLPTLGKGSLQNLSDMINLKGIDIGFVQSDALTYAKQHNLFPNLTQSIQYIAKLYDAEIHVLARQDITRIEDLNGQRVNVDVSGSGSAMTAEILLDALGVKAKLEHDGQITGLQQLERGDIAAIIHVGGAPVPLLAELPSGRGVHFLPVALTPSLAQTYLPDQLTHDAYPALVPAGAPVPTIAVGDVMAVFAWAPRSERYAAVSRFVDAFFSRFDEFRQPPRHPKWRDVNLTAEVPGWTRFQPAQDWLLRQTMAGAGKAATQAQFNDFLSYTKASAGARLTDAQKASLFQDFMAWNRQRSAER